MNNPFENALLQLKRAAKAGGIAPAALMRLSASEKEIRFSIPMKMDDGSQKIFEGYRVQYSSLRGPYKGGIRFHPKTDISEVKALALWMAIKTSVANIPMGGGKGGVTVDPKILSRGELERLSRGFVKAIWRDIGPAVDVPAPDVNTTPEIMSWMNDEYKKLSGEKTDATFTGKPIKDGGSEGRGPATGLGGYYVFEALRKSLKIKDGASVAIQGMGNVGGNAAEIFTAHGYKVVAMSDSKGAIYDPSGLDPKAVEQFKKEKGTVKNFPAGKNISNKDLLLLPVEVLVPAALENQITKANAAKIKAKVVLELANGPTTPEADDILFKKKITVIPDVLANSGGVIVSYFEWEQNMKGEKWSEETVGAKLKEILERETAVVYENRSKFKTDLRRAAFICALGRLAKAEE